MQTLTQLLPLEVKPSVELPALEIADYPRFLYRELFWTWTPLLPSEGSQRYLDLLRNTRSTTFNCISPTIRDGGLRSRISKLTEIGSHAKRPSRRSTSSLRWRWYSSRRFLHSGPNQRSRCLCRGAFITIVPEVEMPDIHRRRWRLIRSWLAPPAHFRSAPHGVFTLTCFVPRKKHSSSWKMSSVSGHLISVSLYSHWRRRVLKIGGKRAPMPKRHEA